MKRLKLKLILLFVLLLVASAFISFIISLFFTNYNLRDEIIQNQKSTATSIIELSEKTDLDLDEIINLSSNPIYYAHKIEDIHSLNITNDEILKVQNSEIVSLSHSQFGDISTVFMVDNSYIQISISTQNNIFFTAIFRLGLTLLLCVLIGAFLMVCSAKRAVKPIIKLTDATKEVAKGNFDIVVQNKSKDEIGQLTNNFNLMTQELKNIEYLRKDFISNVSHEFKTPIASVQGFAKLLKNEDISKEDRQEYVDIIIEESERLSKLSSNMLKLSKIENQQTLKNKTVFSLDEQIRRTILLLQNEWSEKNLHLDIDLNEISFVGDDELLQQVWINLLSNAIKFSAADGTIIVTLHQEGNKIIVKISDTGIGMDDITQQRIFEKFYQGDKSHSSEGNGLGLALVKRILDLCNGKIFVQSQVNEGATFIVELPVE